MLYVLTQALTAAPPVRLPGNHTTAAPYSPILRHADLAADTTVPWWDRRQLRFEFA